MTQWEWRSGRRLAPRRRRGAWPGACPARAARGEGPSGRGSRRRRRSASCERDPRRREPLEARGVVGGDDEGPVCAPVCELAVEELHARLVEAAERLVEHVELGLVQEGAAEREPLQHPARERAGTLRTRVPELEPFEQHPDPLAPFGHAIEPPVEVEVLEGRQLAVHERLVADEAEPGTVDADLELARGGRGEPGAEAEERRLPGAVGAGDDQEAALLELEVEAVQDPLPTVTLPEGRGLDHVNTSSRTNAKKTTLITPFTVKKAASRRRRSPGRTSECSYANSAATAATPSQ